MKLTQWIGKMIGVVQHKVAEPAPPEALPEVPLSLGVSALAEARARRRLERETDNA